MVMDCLFANRLLPFGEYAVSSTNAMVTKENRLKLALETGFSLRTIEKWSDGKKVAESTDRALKKASSELELRQFESAKEA
jgi:hypothetical protein